MDGWIDRCMHAGRQAYRQTNGLTDGQTLRQTDRQIDKYVHTYIHTYFWNFFDILNRQDDNIKLKTTISDQSVDLFGCNNLQRYTF